MMTLEIRNDITGVKKVTPRYLKSEKERVTYARFSNFSDRITSLHAESYVIALFV
jgi:hypothetical protein